MNVFTTTILASILLIGCSGNEKNTIKDPLGGPSKVCVSVENGWCLLKGRYEILSIIQNENIKTWHLKIDSQSDGYPMVKLSEPKSCRQQITNQVKELSRNMKVDDEDGSWKVLKINFSENEKCDMQFFIPANSQSLAINNFFQTNIGICEKNNHKTRVCNQRALAYFIKRIEIDESL